MRAVKAQYFFLYAVTGSILPYLSVFFAQGRGMNDHQIGIITAMTGVAVLLSPVVLTLLADAHLENAALLGGLQGAGVVALVGLGLAHGFWMLLGGYLLFSLAAVPVTPLSDGLNFAVQHQRERRGKPPVAYHKVRVWGTIGFIVPSLGLAVLIGSRLGVQAVVVVGAGFAGLGAINALRLPRVRRETHDQPRPAADPDAPRDTGLASTSPQPGENAPQRGRLPTAAAARVFAQPQVMVFAIAMWLLQMSAAAYYTYYPLYLTRLIGIDARWVGLIACIGVAIEIFFMLGFGWLLRHLGLKRLIVVGSGFGVLRMGLLWLWPTAAVAIGTQLLHGMMVLVLHVAAPVYLNHRAAPAYRNSIQGLYTMSVPGSARLLGPIVAGAVAAWSLRAMFAYAGVLCLAAVVLMGVGFTAEHVQADGK